jgi:glycosyltransferase involved in cell wall biosynthesis
MAGMLDLLFSWILEVDTTRVQLIIVHDQQDDATSEELHNRLASVHNSEILFIEGHYHAPGIARNAGLSRANGRWIQFVDSDDLPDIGKSLNMISESPPEAEILVGKFSYFDVMNSETYRLEPNRDPKIELALNPGLWRLIIRREILTGHKFGESRMAEDQLFLLEINLFRRNLNFSPESIYRYSTNQRNQLTSRVDVLEDLKIIIPRTFELYSAALKFDKKYVGIFLSRQTLTYLKSGMRINGKIKLLYALFSKLTYKQKIRLFTSVVYVAMHRNKYVFI